MSACMISYLVCSSPWLWHCSISGITCVSTCIYPMACTVVFLGLLQQGTANSEHVLLAWSGALLIQEGLCCSAILLTCTPGHWPKILMFLQGIQRSRVAGGLRNRASSPRLPSLRWRDCLLSCCPQPVGWVVLLEESAGDAADEPAQ